MEEVPPAGTDTLKVREEKTSLSARGNHVDGGGPRAPADFATHVGKHRKVRCLVKVPVWLLPPKRHKALKP